MNADPAGNPPRSAATGSTSAASPPRRVGSDVPFYAAMSILGGAYVLLLIALLIGDVAYMLSAPPPADVLPAGWEGLRSILRPVLPILAALEKPAIRYSIKLSLVSCFTTALLSLWVAVPTGYLLSRCRFPGRNLVDAILDIPIVLPPLVVGLSLLILFQFPPFSLTSAWVVYKIPAVILAQFMVAAAFAVRTMRATFDSIDTRREEVALTLGCTRAQAFGMVVLPEARQGILTAGTLAWARALGEFGPLLVFAGATRHKTEVLSTTVFLELSIGELEAAVAVSLIMVAAAVVVLVIARMWGTRSLTL